MTYNEFRNTYKWAIKHYPGTDTFCNLMEKECGTVTMIRYQKTGGRWKKTRESEETFTGRFYMNTIDAVPFFRNCGGTERVEAGYTFYGYIPVKVVSISPDRQTKVERKFSFKG